MELNKIYNMDCLEYMRTLPDESVDMVFCDSPYGQNIRNERGKIKFDCEWCSEEEFIEWCRKWLFESKRILKKGGMLMVWGVAPIINELSHVMNKELEMKFYSQIIWHVSDGLRPTNNYFYSNHQVLLGYSKDDKDVFNGFNNHGGVYNHFTEQAFIRQQADPKGASYHAGMIRFANLAYFQHSAFAQLKLITRLQIQGVHFID